MSLQKILIRVHFTTLVLVFLNATINSMTPYSLVGNIEFFIKIVTVISGLILFFFYLKPFKKINIYFSLYGFVSFLLMIGVVFRGLFWALVLSVFLFPLIPESNKYEENGIMISMPYQGFMAPCCTYEVKERIFFVFEKVYKNWILEGEGPIKIVTIKTYSNGDGIEITYSTDFDGEIIKKRFFKKKSS